MCLVELYLKVGPLFFMIVFQAQIWTCGVFKFDSYLKLNFGFELQNLFQKKEGLKLY